MLILLYIFLNQVRGWTNCSAVFEEVYPDISVQCLDNTIWHCDGELACNIDIRLDIISIDPSGTLCGSFSCKTTNKCPSK